MTRKAKTRRSRFVLKKSVLATTRRFTKIYKRKNYKIKIIKKTHQTHRKKSILNYIWKYVKIKKYKLYEGVVYVEYEDNRGRTTTVEINFKITKPSSKPKKKAFKEIIQDVKDFLYSKPNWITMLIDYGATVKLGKKIKIKASHSKKGKHKIIEKGKNYESDENAH